MIFFSIFRGVLITCFGLASVSTASVRAKFAIICSKNLYSCICNLKFKKIKNWTKVQHIGLQELRGGGVNPDFWETTNLRYELVMMARTCTNNLKVVLSP